MRLTQILATSVHIQYNNLIVIYEALFVTTTVRKYPNVASNSIAFTLCYHNHVMSQTSVLFHLQYFAV